MGFSLVLQLHGRVRVPVCLNVVLTRPWYLVSDACAVVWIAMPQVESHQHAAAMAKATYDYQGVGNKLHALVPQVALSITIKQCRRVCARKLAFRHCEERFDATPAFRRTRPYHSLDYIYRPCVQRFLTLAVSPNPSTTVS